MTEKPYITNLRLPPDLAAVLKRRAKLMNRSVNEQIVVMIKRGFVLDLNDEEALKLANEKLEEEK